MANDDKPQCKYGDKCFRKNEDHFKKYKHETEDDKESDSIKNGEIKLKSKRAASEMTEYDNDLTTQSSTKLTKQEDIESLILEEYKMKMPNDFYDLLSFCKSLNEDDPKSETNLLIHVNDSMNCNCIFFK
jgi:hypothetical protein